MSQKDCAVIIGGGPAGLTAAWSLLEGGYPGAVRVLEADFCVGGISRTVVHNGNRLDIGGHRFFTKSQTVSDLWHTILPASDGDLLLRPRFSHIYHRAKFFPYPLKFDWGVVRNLGLGRTIGAGWGYLMAQLHKRPEVSLEDFYINRFGRPLYTTFFEDYTEKVWGVHPRDLDAGWGAQRVKGLSIASLLKDLLLSALHIKNKKKETSLIEEFEYPRLGPGQMWERLAEMIREKGGSVELNTRCTALNVGPDGEIVSVEAQRSDGEHETIPCRVVFSSMPIKDLVAALKGAQVPRDVARAASELPYRDFITVGLLVKKLKIKQTTDTWIYIQEPGVKVGRMQIINNWSPDMVADPSTTWIALEYFCNEGDEMWTAPEDEFIRSAIGEMVKIGILDSADEVLDTVEVKMPKAYPAYFGSYKDMDKIRACLDSIPNLYCIGRNGQHRYNNMDHSMLTAILAADTAMGHGPGREAIWNVNTESDYHESSD